jgi:hypothetical protein
MPDAMSEAELEKFNVCETLSAISIRISTIDRRLRSEPKPTVAELEAILNSADSDDRPIEINPDGSITVL